MCWSTHFLKHRREGWNSDWEFLKKSFWKSLILIKIFCFLLSASLVKLVSTTCSKTSFFYRKKIRLQPAIWSKTWDKKISCTLIKKGTDLNHHPKSKYPSPVCSNQLLTPEKKFLKWRNNFAQSLWLEFQGFLVLIYETKKLFRERYKLKGVFLVWCNRARFTHFFLGKTIWKHIKFWNLN